MIHVLYDDNGDQYAPVIGCAVCSGGISDRNSGVFMWAKTEQHVQSSALLAAHESCSQVLENLFASMHPGTLIDELPVHEFLNMLSDNYEGA